jgi:Fe-S-cluster containining protein
VPSFHNCADVSGNGTTFSCTKCARCCRGHNLPLTWEEALFWLNDGGQVDVYCEADVWPMDSVDALRAAHRQRRSFPALCGNIEVRITAILVAVITGPCRYLAADLSCRIYDRRPLVCRIYPAEINPFIQLQPSRKACPREAWDAREPLVTSDLQTFIERSRQTDQDDAPQKSLLCRQLRVNVAALAGEGFVRYSPEVHTLREAMHNIRSATLKPSGDPSPWRLFSPDPESVKQLSTNGAAVAFKGPNDSYSYLLA